MLTQDENVRLALVEEAVKRLAESHQDISESLKQMVRLETCHAETRDGLNRAFAEMEKQEARCMDAAQKQEERIRKIEEALPELKRTSHWVMGGVIAVVAAAFALVWLSAVDHIETHPISISTRVPE